MDCDEDELRAMGLTEYEIRRPPIAVVDDGREIDRSVRELNAHLTCPICLGVLRRTMAVRSCLHRFCAACIDRSLRQGLKECPTCRAHCSSRRALHPDAEFDALIALLYPDLDTFERLQADLVARINRSVSSASLRLSLDRAVALHASPAQKRRRCAARPASPDPLRRAGEKVEEEGVGEDADEARKGPTDGGIDEEEEDADLARRVAAVVAADAASDAELRPESYAALVARAARGGSRMVAAGGLRVVLDATRVAPSSSSSPSHSRWRDAPRVWPLRPEDSCAALVAAAGLGDAAMAVDAVAIVGAEEWPLPREGPLLAHLLEALRLGVARGAIPVVRLSPIQASSSPS
jgi:hypothetical protein